MRGHQDRYRRNHDGDQSKRWVRRGALVGEARYPQYGGHDDRMDRNVADADCSTYEKLAQHAGRSGAMASSSVDWRSSYARWIERSVVLCGAAPSPADLGGNKYSVI